MITGVSSIVTAQPNLEREFRSSFRMAAAGDNFLAWLTLAIGAALAGGTGLAVLRPQERDGEVVRAPVGRSLIQITIGTLATVWALATLLS
jgi:hypothetical protein